MSQTPIKIYCYFMINEKQLMNTIHHCYFKIPEKQYNTTSNIEREFQETNSKVKFYLHLRAFTAAFSPR